MDLQKKLDQLLDEKAAYERHEAAAHAQVIETNKKIRKLELFMSQAEEMFGAELPVIEREDENSGEINYAEDDRLDGPSEHFNR